MFNIEEIREEFRKEILDIKAQLTRIEELQLQILADRDDG